MSAINMKKPTLLILVCLLCLQTNFGLESNEDLQSFLESCCQLGTSRASVLPGLGCDDPGRSLDALVAGSRQLVVSPDDLDEQTMQCKMTYKTCCNRQHKTSSCDSGKQVSIQGGKDCSSIPFSVSHSETFGTCCGACTLGIKVARRGGKCSFASSFGPFFDNSYFECCSEEMHKQRTNSDLTTTPSYANNRPTSRCEMANTCSQICKDSENGRDVTCSCIMGYRLGRDGRTCEDVDECREIDPCSSDQECVNIVGGHECITKETETSTASSFWNRPRSPYDIDDNWMVDVTKVEPGGDSARDDVTRVVPRKSAEASSGLPFSLVKTGSRCPTGYRNDPRHSKVCIDVDECNEGDTDCEDYTVCQNLYGKFTCVPRPSTYPYNAIREGSGSDSCAPGLRKKSNECLDIDECRIGSHSCNLESEVCENIVGDYRCISKDGSQAFHSNTPINSDYSSAISRTPDSGYRRTQPVYTDQSSSSNAYRTAFKESDPKKIQETGIIIKSNEDETCKLGFTKNSVTSSCEDIDECRENRCPNGLVCRNTEGSFQCVCDQGYALIGGQCKDINECYAGVHNCREGERCDNTIGSFNCVRESTCGTGYNWNPDLKDCEDNDECVLSSRACGPSYECRNIPGSFRCIPRSCPPGSVIGRDGVCQGGSSCRPGLRFDRSTQTCVDVDECLVGSHDCRSNQICINQVGSFSCKSSLECDAGFVLNPTKDRCVDIDECLLSIHDCKEDQKCVNSFGSYECRCRYGYQLDENRTCVDVNECEVYSNHETCNSISSCNNTIGSYECTCKPGYQMNDQNLCEDLNECEENPTICEHSCTNTVGSHVCSCNTGYEPFPNDTSICVDVDECLHDQAIDEDSEKKFNKHIKYCQGFCLNSNGSYSCSCPPGYTLNVDGKSCDDKDECTEEPCDEGEDICLNTKGGFKCYTIECVDGYGQDSTHTNRCLRNATAPCDETQSCLNVPKTYSNYYLTLVSWVPIPNPGYLDLFSLRGPPGTNVIFTIDSVNATSVEGAEMELAEKSTFFLRPTKHNENMISIRKSIQGPQDITLVIDIKAFQRQVLSASNKVNIFIHVSMFDY